MADWWNTRREVLGESEEEATLILRWATEQAGATQEEIARRLGMSRNTVKAYLAGTHKRPGWRMVMRWLRVCGYRVVMTRERE